MMLESQTCRDLAAFFSSLKGSAWLETPELARRHASIQQGLGALSSFFEGLAVLAEQTESSLLSTMPYSGGGSAGLTSSVQMGQLVPLALSGKTGTATIKAHYAGSSASMSWEDENVGLQAHIGAVEGDVKCVASVKLWEKGTFNPKVNVDTKLSASLVNVNAKGQVGNDKMSASAQLQAEAGAVYAAAKAVISSKGIDLDAKAGAACARASCVLTFDLLGLKLTCTLTGTLGGAEASAVYKCTTGSWECGVGAAVGIGGGMKLGISWD